MYFVWVRFKWTAYWWKPQWFREWKTKFVNKNGCFCRCLQLCRSFISLSLNINEKQLVCLKCQLFILLINYCFLSVSTYSLWIHPKVCGVEFLFYYCLFDLKFKFWTKSFISTFTANKWFIDEIATLACVFVIQNECVVLDNMSWFPTQINHLSFHGNGFHLA